tara:strand:+ start:11657 stop:11779 length:123 start_codon:yes stop_codon:yes gene_type:complete
MFYFYIYKLWDLLFAGVKNIKPLLVKFLLGLFAQAKRMYA